MVGVRGQHLRGGERRTGLRTETLLLVLPSPEHHSARCMPVWAHSAPTQGFQGSGGIDGLDAETCSLTLALTVPGVRGTCTELAFPLALSQASP